MKFTLEIELGNDGMSTRDQLVAAIRGVAKRIADHGYPVDRYQWQYRRRLALGQRIRWSSSI